MERTFEKGGREGQKRRVMQENEVRRWTLEEKGKRETYSSLEAQKKSKGTPGVSPKKDTEGNVSAQEQFSWHTESRGDLRVDEKGGKFNQRNGFLMEVKVRTIMRVNFKMIGESAVTTGTTKQRNLFSSNSRTVNM